MIPRISIATIDEREEAASPLPSQVEHYRTDIEHLAFDYYQRRGRLTGKDWDDWLRAEQELVWKPRAEMFQNASAIVLRVAVPGFGPKSLAVTAAPHSLAVQGCETHQHESLGGRLRFCEFGQRLFRHFDLPARIDPKTVSATLDKGILEIFASIARPRSKTATM